MLSNLPPGVTNSMIDRQSDDHCGCCGRYQDDCICPECTVCGEYGDPRCYQKHGMVYSREQLIGQATQVISQINTMIGEDQMFLIEASVIDKDSDAYISDQDFKKIINQMIEKYKNWTK